MRDTLGQSIYVRFPGFDWIVGRIELESTNGRSLAISFERGMPLPYAIDSRTGRYTVLLLKQDDGTWLDVQGGRKVETRPYPCVICAGCLPEGETCAACGRQA